MCETTTEQTWHNSFSGELQSKDQEESVGEQKHGGSNGSEGSSSWRKETLRIDDTGDFIFRFHLPVELRPPLHEDPLIELVRQQICNLLDVAVFTAEEREVRIDGFKLLVNLDRRYHLFDNPHCVGGCQDPGMDASSDSESD